MLAVLISAVAFGAGPDAAVVEALDANRLKVSRTGMSVLGGWAVGNLAVGGVGVAVAEDEQWRSFHGANAGWNAVNLGIAGASLLSTRGQTPGSVGWPGALTETRKLERALAFNAGLDVAYGVIGAWLWERGTRLDDPRQLGWGQALVLQGGFLFAFDVTLLGQLRRGEKRALAGRVMPAPAPGTGGSGPGSASGR